MSSRKTLINPAEHKILQIGLPTLQQQKDAMLLNRVLGERIRLYYQEASPAFREVMECIDRQTPFTEETTWHE